MTVNDIWPTVYESQHNFSFLLNLPITLFTWPTQYFSLQAHQKPSYFAETYWKRFKKKCLPFDCANPSIKMFLYWQRFVIWSPVTAAFSLTTVVNCPGRCSVQLEPAFGSAPSCCHRLFRRPASFCDAMSNAPRLSESLIWFEKKVCKPA